LKDASVNDERKAKVDVTKIAGDPMKVTDPKKDKAVWVTGEGVEEAMRELSEMEHKLQDAVRTQRLAVESSDLHVKKEVSEEPDIRPKMYSPNTDTVTARGNLDRKSNVSNTAPLDEDDAKLAAGDVADAKDEDDSASRGANRPPPVNSEVLPLPWKGRLGYVSRIENYFDVANWKGLPEYISAQRDTSCVFFENLPYSFNPRTSTSFGE
jgi:UV DNA damage endonuclease